MVAFGAYTFTAASGDLTLRDLFSDNDQLVVYQFMDLGPDARCPGCTHVTNNVTALTCSPTAASPGRQCRTCRSGRSTG